MVTTGGSAFQQEIENNESKIYTYLNLKCLSLLKGQMDSWYSFTKHFLIFEFSV